MKLNFSPTSPFVRKVMLCAHEKGFADDIEMLPESSVLETNPLSKVPALLTDAGTALYDSYVICDYLDNLDGAPALIPSEAVARTVVLRRHALADGIMEAAVAMVMESRRPEDKQWNGFLDAQQGKIERALDVLEAQASGYADTVDLGTLSVGAAVSYLDLRLHTLAWRDERPTLAAWYASFSERPSMQATALPK